MEKELEKLIVTDINKDIELMIRVAKKAQKMGYPLTNNFYEYKTVALRLTKNFCNYSSGVYGAGKDVHSYIGSNYENYIFITANEFLQEPNINTATKASSFAESIAQSLVQG